MKKRHNVVKSVTIGQGMYSYSTCCYLLIKYSRCESPQIFTWSPKYREDSATVGSISASLSSALKGPATRQVTQNNLIKKAHCSILNWI